MQFSHFWRVEERYCWILFCISWRHVWLGKELAQWTAHKLFMNGIDRLVSQRDKCINTVADYFWGNKCFEYWKKKILSWTRVWTRVFSFMCWHSDQWAIQDKHRSAIELISCSYPHFDFGTHNFCLIMFYRGMHPQTLGCPQWSRGYTSLWIWGSQVWSRPGSMDFFRA